MQQKFRLAIVGAGLITENAHLPAALASEAVAVAAIVDPAIERAEALARRFGIEPRIARSVDEVMDGLDGALIATPNHTHREIAVRCLDAGVSVLIEKPLAHSYAEGQAIVDAAERSKKVAAVGYCTRFRTSTVLMKRLLDQNFFGEVRRFYHQFGTPGGWGPVSGYILKRASIGGGVLVVTGTHFLDRMLHFWGYPDSSRLADDSDGGAEANAIASFHYGRGSQPLEGMARYSKTTALPGGMVLETEAGIVTLADNDDADIELRPAANPDLRQVIREGSRKPANDVFLAQLEDFVQACREGIKPRITASEGLQSLRLLDDLYGNRTRLLDRWYDQNAEASWASV
jgi:predicted dehydrogenase